MTDILVLVGIAVLVGLVLRRIVKPRRSSVDVDVDVDDLEAPTTASRAARGAVAGGAGATYRALLARYRPAYKGASNINTVAAIFVVVGVAAIVWGVTLFDGYSLQQALAPLLVGGGFFSVVVGLILSMLASLLRAVLDRTAFVAPELDDAARIRLAFEAGGEAGPAE